MISLHTAPARLRHAMVEYLAALWVQLRLLARAGEYIAMPEFTAADLLKIIAPIRMGDLYAGCFLPPRKRIWAYPHRDNLPHARRAATIASWQANFYSPAKTRACNKCRKKTCACGFP